jgi:hypothetical protein
MATLDPIKNPKDFTAAIRAFMQQQGMNIIQLAAHMKMGRGGIEHYLYSPPKSATFRRKVTEKYPEIFGGEQAEVSAEAVSDGEKTSAPKTSPTLVMRDLSVLTKIEQARSLVAGLSAQITWFLYEANETERNLFRDELGPAWEHFQYLVRAMHGETAFKIAKSEGRL